MSWSVDEQWLESEITKALNVEEPITALRIAKDQQGRSKGCVPVLFPPVLTGTDSSLPHAASASSSSRTPSSLTSSSR